MIRILSGIFFIVIFHIIIFVLYPDTGKYGNYYFYGFIALWSFLYIYFSLNIRVFNLFPFSLIIKILFFTIMFLTVTIITPQDDKKTILSKILSKKFPDADTINRGKIKYLNSFFNLNIERNINYLKKEIQNFFEKIKE
jgi:hypothetical protein